MGDSTEKHMVNFFNDVPELDMFTPEGAPFGTTPGLFTINIPEGSGEEHYAVIQVRKDGGYSILENYYGPIKDLPEKKDEDNSDQKPKTTPDKLERDKEYSDAIESTKLLVESYVKKFSEINKKTRADKINKS